MGVSEVAKAYDVAGSTIELCRMLGVDPIDYEDTLELLEAAKDAVGARFMPEGTEWPRFEDGEPVRIGDVVSDVEVRSVVFRDDGILLSDCMSVPGWGTWHSYKEPIKRPAVLAADGEPLEVGQTVWHVSNGIQFSVVGLPKSGEYRAVKLRLDDGAFTGLDPDQLTHQRPVLDADGVPIREGDTVWFKTSGEEMRADKIEHRPEGFWALELFADGSKRNSAPVGVLTHTKPEPPDSAERIAEDIKRMAEEWCSYPSLREASEKAASSVGEATMGVALGNLSKRCRALAERERSE